MNQADPAAAVTAEQPQRKVVLRARKTRTDGPGSRSGSARESRGCGLAGSEITRRTSAARPGVARSSASIESTQSPEAAASAQLRWLAKSSNARTITTSAFVSAISQGGIVAGRVDNHNAFVGPARGAQAFGEVVRLVLGDDQDRKAGIRHSAPPS